MEQLPAEQQANLRKMSSERIQGRLMRAGLDEEKNYAMDRETVVIDTHWPATGHNCGLLLTKGRPQTVVCGLPLVCYCIMQ